MGTGHGEEGKEADVAMMWKSEVGRNPCFPFHRVPPEPTAAPDAGGGAAVVTGGTAAASAKRAPTCTGAADVGTASESVGGGGDADAGGGNGSGSGTPTATNSAADEESREAGALVGSCGAAAVAPESLQAGHSTGHGAGSSEARGGFL